MAGVVESPSCQPVTRAGLPAWSKVPPHQKPGASGRLTLPAVEQQGRGCLGASGPCGFRVSPGTVPAQHGTPRSPGLKPCHAGPGVEYHHHRAVMGVERNRSPVPSLPLKHTEQESTALPTHLEVVLKNPEPGVLLLGSVVVRAPQRDRTNRMCARVRVCVYVQRQRFISGLVRLCRLANPKSAGRAGDPEER